MLHERIGSHWFLSMITSLEGLEIIMNPTPREIVLTQKPEKERAVVITVSSKYSDRTSAADVSEGTLDAGRRGAMRKAMMASLASGLPSLKDLENNIAIVSESVGELNVDAGHPAVFKDPNPRDKAILRSSGPNGLLFITPQMASPGHPYFPNRYCDSRKPLILRIWPNNGSKDPTLSTAGESFLYGTITDTEWKPEGVRAIPTGQSDDLRYWDHVADLTYEAILPTNISKLTAFNPNTPLPHPHWTPHTLHRAGETGYDVIVARSRQPRATGRCPGTLWPCVDRGNLHEQPRRNPGSIDGTRQPSLDQTRRHMALWLPITCIGCRNKIFDFRPSKVLSLYASEDPR